MSHHMIIHEWLTREMAFYNSIDIEEQDVCNGYHRLAYIFHIDPCRICWNYIIGQELNASFVSSYFKRNELDQLWSDMLDLHDILESKIRDSTIEKVKDFIVLLSMCRIKNARKYDRLMYVWRKEEKATKIGRILKTTIGFVPKRFANLRSQGEQGEQRGIRVTSSHFTNDLTE